jgi:exopolyphosphatase/guanosine-5'-triphosphate,3'-diphosphate pyrophosphatase
VDERLAVIDIGSNSGRVVVVEPTPEGHLGIVADARLPLRLARDVAQSGKLGAGAIERTLESFRDFLAVARGAGAARVVAVATAAVRVASDKRELVERIHRETGVEVDVIDGGEEASYAFLGAISGLPAEHGFLLDVGGGSTEISRFRDRVLTRSWTLSLGALALSDRFLASDPAAEIEMDQLREHVGKSLRREDLPPLEPDEVLIGTGGTVRNLARIDERRHRYPVPHLHGYVLSKDRLGEELMLLAGRRRSKRRTTPGLNADRADSIVGGAVVVEQIMRALGATEVMISGQGLREGLALSVLGCCADPARVKRRASVDALCARFASWNPERADRRRECVRILLGALAPDAATEACEMIEHASFALDVGRSIDYYERHQHAASVVLASDLAGFSHAQLAFVAAVMRQAAGERTSKAYRPVLDREQREAVSRAGAVLTLADEVERRTPPGESIALQCSIRGRDAVVYAPVLSAWRPRQFADRFLAAFHLRLVVDGADR